VFPREGAAVSSEEGVMGAEMEEGGGEGLRRAVKSTADEERCIRARTQFVPQDYRLSWGESSTRPKDSRRDACKCPANLGSERCADDAESGLIVWAGLELTVVWCGVVRCGQRMNVSGGWKEGDEG
jgi:hypothetical protein